MTNSKITVLLLLLVPLGCSERKNGIDPTAALTVSPRIGDTVTAFYLSGEGSRNHDDIPFGLTYYWILDDTIHLAADSTQSRTSFRLKSFGPHLFKLIVKNVWGDKDSATTNVLVQEFQKESTYQDPRDGQIYKTVLIGKYWWFAENLRYGSAIQPREQPTDNNIVEKYVRNLDSLNQGGFYSPEEVHLYSLNPDTSICPPGWSLPFSQPANDIFSYIFMLDPEVSKKMFISGFLSGLSWKPGGGYYNIDGARFEVSDLSFWWAKEIIYPVDSEVGYDLIYFWGDGPHLLSWNYIPVTHSEWYPKSRFALPVRCIKKN
jgi:uncharacterized protein (TIGR02145 family)